MNRLLDDLYDEMRKCQCGRDRHMEVYAREQVAEFICECGLREEVEIVASDQDEQMVRY